MPWYDTADMRPILIAITGEPCTGKTTVMQSLLAQSGTFQGWNTCLYGHVPIVYTVSGCFGGHARLDGHACLGGHAHLGVIGLYSDTQASGVDDQDIYLPDLMGPHDFLERFAGFAIFVEGTRVLDKSFLKWAEVHTDLHLFELTANWTTLKARYNTRGGVGKRAAGEWASKHMCGFRDRFAIQTIPNDSPGRADAIATMILAVAAVAQAKQNVFAS